MALTWQWQHVYNADELEEVPPAVSPTDAQQWCNFIIWMPDQDGDYSVENATIRKEAPPGRIEGVTVGRTPWTPNNPSAYRYEVTVSTGRIRVKEFLYDWAFPATDHPSLWRSEVKAIPLNDEYVLWLGKNYYGQQAASTRLARTMIEISVLKGEITEDDMLNFFRSLHPVSKTVAQRITATPFSVLSYWARYKADLVGVPTGLWAFQRKSGPPEEEWIKNVESALKQLNLPMALGEYIADDVAILKDDHNHIETEACYVAGRDRGHELRLTVQKYSHGRIIVPPDPEPHPHESEVLDLDGTSVYVAWEDKRYGSFDAVWHDLKYGQDLRLASTTGTHLDYDWFMEALKNLVKR